MSETILKISLQEKVV